jgi:elongation factor P--(R)-beta-lysine ligase
MLAQARLFFANRGIMEVDCGALSPYASIDRHIDLIEARVSGRRMFLHSSPEYAMKRLLVEGSGDIYQLGHVFRDGEEGPRHRPEFTMAEWYRLAFSFQQMIDETIAFTALFVGERTTRQLTFEKLFASHGGIPADHTEMHRMLALEIEPSLDPDVTHIITHFPASEAALAQVDGDHALRFELFVGGFEVANGYQELEDPGEHRRRFAEANRPDYPEDELFLSALERGLPPCCGVAVGFDRLMMARHSVAQIGEILP